MLKKYFDKNYVGVVKKRDTIDVMMKQRLASSVENKKSKNKKSIDNIIDKPDFNKIVHVDEKVAQARREIDGKVHEEKKEIDEQPNPNFDFNKYMFVDKDTMSRLKFISEEFIKQGQLNSDKIRRLIIHSIYDQVQNKLNQELEINPTNKHNVDLWVKLFVRVKPIQTLATEMTEKVEFLLRKELIHNKDQLKAYINFPRLEDKAMTVVPPKEKK